MHISLRKYAQKRGISLAAVQKAIKTGRIHTEPDGLIDSEKADREWRQNTRECTNSAASDSTYLKAHKLRLFYEAKLAKLEIDVREGHLVDRTKINRITFERARRARDRLLMVPRRLAAQIAAESDPEKIRSMMQDALTDALEDIADPNGPKPLWEAKA